LFAVGLFAVGLFAVELLSVELSLNPSPSVVSMTSIIPGSDVPKHPLKMSIRARNTGVDLRWDIYQGDSHCLIILALNS